MNNYVSQALENLSFHAKHYASCARGSGDEKSAFVYTEVASMLSSLTEMKRSPLFDALNQRVATKARDGAYQDVRRIGVALTVLWMKNGLTRRHASQMAAGVTGVSMSVIEKKSGIPSDLKLLDAFVFETPDVLEAISAHRMMSSSGSDEDTIAELEKNAARLAAFVDGEDWRKRELARAFTAKVDTDTNLRLLDECAREALDAVASD